MAWSDEQVGLLKQLHASGHSYSNMAAELGYARNAIAGKLFRLGLTEDARPRDTRPKTPPRPRRTKPEERFWHMHKPKKELPPVAVETVEVHHKTIFELGFGECRWPLGEPMEPAKFFCAEPALPGRPYCAKHTRIACSPTPGLRTATLARIA